VLVGPSQDITSRLQLEQSSGQTHTIDLVMSGANSLYSGMYDGHLLEPLKPRLVLPDVLNGANWQIGRPWFMDPDQQYILRLITTVSGFVTVNTDAIKPDELKSWKDLLKPQYVGKICGFDPTVNGNGAQEAVALAIKLGDDFVKQLFLGQKVTTSTDNQQLADWLGHGKYPIGLAFDADFVERLKKDGLPVAVTAHFPEMPGYITAGAGLLAMVKDPPHPNAAAVFANWIASKEGNELFAKGVAYVSPLTTVKSDWVPDYTLPRSGEDYIDAYDWTYALQTYPGRYKALQQMLKT
jgi:ABC-type Fe3+ transport system substrate-binding protein